MYNIQVMKQALEALYELHDLTSNDPWLDRWSEAINALRTAIEQAEKQEPSQDWAGMDGATAWQLIHRHADGWADIAKMMGEWLAANTLPAAQPAPAQVSAIPKGWSLVAVTGFDDLMYWLDRCESKGHLENCPDLIEPYQAFDYQPVAIPSAATQPYQGQT